MTEQQITVPDLGDDGGAEVIEILLQVGDSLEKEDIVVVLESDKATMEIPSEHSGVLQSMNVAIGDQISSGDLIAVVNSEGIEAKSDKSSDEQSKQQTTKDNDSTPAISEKTESDKKPSKQVEKRLEIETVPDTGSEGSSELIEILCAVGDSVKKDDILFVLESDKATMEFPASFNGEVTQLFVKLGDQLSFGDQLLEINTEDPKKNEENGAEDSEENSEENSAGESIDKMPQAKQSKEQVAKTKKPPAKAQQPQQKQVSSYRNPNVHAGPAARRLSRELGVDLSSVKPSGPKDRILKDDIKAFVKVNLNKPTSGGGLNLELPDIDFSKFGEIETQKLTRIKKVSAKNLSRSWLTIPHVTQFDEADITDLEKFRKQESAALKEQGIKLTPLAFLVKASAKALQEFPSFNASLDKSGEQLILKKYFNIGVAVDTPDGLVVPIVKDANQKSVTQIAIELGEISEKARNKKLKPQDMQGACFSISSLGGIGGTAFTPIVNWPEVAILGVSRSQMKPVYDGKEFIPRLMLPLSLSYDHRVIDGAQAARFSRYLCELLDDEKLLLL
jgi:pyruvate dehydrogenase E2 component (dihydrolipoamide acetyltransferase)